MIIEIYNVVNQKPTADNTNAIKIVLLPKSEIDLAKLQKV